MKRVDRFSECDWARAELAERAPAADVAGRLAEHLQTCQACRAASDWHRRLSSLATDCTSTSAPDLAARVQVLVRRRRRARRRTVQLTLATSAALVLALGAHSFLSVPEEKHRSDAPLLAAHVPSSRDLDALSELTLLVTAPPVPSVAGCPSAWLTVLSELSQGEQP